MCVQPVNAQTLAVDPATDALAQLWTARAFAYFRQSGFDPTQTAGYITTPLDGLETDVRSKPTALSVLVADAMWSASKRVGQSGGGGWNTQLSVVNGGSIRIDDVIPVTDAINCALPCALLCAVVVCLLCCVVCVV